MAGRLHPTLLRVLCCYGALSPAALVGLPGDLPFSTVHEFFLTLLDDPHFRAYPPSPEFQRSWWKWVVDQLEALLRSDVADTENDEVDARVYEYYTSLLCSQPSATATLVPAVPQPSYLTYFLPPGSDNTAEVDVSTMDRLTLRESRTMIEAGTTGLRTWPASLVLADFLLTNPVIVQGKSVLELGSGVGFLGAVVAAIQAKGTRDAASLHLTDLNAQVLDRCHENLQLPCNALDLNNVHIHEIDWFDALNADVTSLSSSLLDKIRPDVILGADVVYDPEIIPALVATLGLAINGTAEAYVALTIRNEATIDRFLDAVRARYRLEDIPWDKPSFLQTQTGDPTPSPVKIVRVTRL